MTIGMIILWVLGLLTVVPYGVYYLLFEAQRSEYPLLITLVLFWVFGFWGIVGPILMLSRVRRVTRALKAATSKEQFEQIIHSQSTQDVAVDLIATENRIPKFLAKRILSIATRELSKTITSPNQRLQRMGKKTASR